VAVGSSPIGEHGCPFLDVVGRATTVAVRTGVADRTTALRISRARLRFGARWLRLALRTCLDASTDEPPGARGY